MISHSTEHSGASGYPRVVLQARPFPSLQSLGWTAGVDPNDCRLWNSLASKTSPRVACHRQSETVYNGTATSYCV